MSLLTVVQRFCRRRNLEVPSAVLGSTDSLVKQIYSLIEEEGDELSKRGDWQALTNEATHTTVATESQGDIDDIATNGFSYIKNGTIWDRDINLPVFVVGSPAWQRLKAISLSGPRYQVRLRGNSLISIPVPTAGHTWAFEYISHNWITDSDGTNPKRYFEADTDVMLLDEELVTLGLTWRWKKEKGLTYAEDFNTYERRVIDALGRNQMADTLCMDNRTRNAKPSVYIQQYTWPL